MNHRSIPSMRLIATCFFAGAMLASPLMAVGQETNAGEDFGTSVDPYQAETWCSLPASAMQEFLRRQSTRKLAAHNDRTSVQRNREEDTVGLLRQVAGTMVGGREVRDALIEGQLWVKTASGRTAIPVTYELTREGNEKVITEFKGARTVSISSGGQTHMSIGSHQVPLSMTTMEDHQITVLPQWSLVKRHSDSAYGIKRFEKTRNLDLVQILPPERRSRLIEALIPTTPSCVAFDPDTLLISRLERVVRPENQLTREHRQSTVYTNYKQIDGVFVPMRQTRYHDGILRDIFTVDTVKFNNGFSSSEFAWPSN